MRIQQFLLYLSVIALSCTTSGNGKKERAREKASSDKTQLETIAKQLYDNKDYAKAKELYDQLVLVDSAKAEYYFKRAVCKTMILGDDPGAIADYLKSIELNYRNKQTAYLN